MSQDCVIASSFGTLGSEVAFVRCCIAGLEGYKLFRVLVVLSSLEFVCKATAIVDECGTGTTG